MLSSNGELKRKIFRSTDMSIEAVPDRLLSLKQRVGGI